MKNQTLSRILNLALAIAIAACDVERIPETQISDSSFWKSETDLRNAANYLYRFLPEFGTDEAWSDDAFGAASSIISDGSRLAPATAPDYNEPYRLIRAANNIIEKASESVVADDIKTRYVAEARFFRAFAYFQLVQKYGDVQLVLTTLADNSPELNSPRAPREQVVEAIYTDLDFAAEILPTPTSLSTTGYGRISKTAALSFKARVGLFEGTRAKFHGYGTPVKHLTIAAEASLKVINSGEHTLFHDYYNLFQDAGEGVQNRENILVKQYGASPTDLILVHHYGANVAYSGLNAPTKALVDSYLMTDGLPIEKSPLWREPKKRMDVFENRDKRLVESVMKEGDSGDYTIKANFQYHRTGYGAQKYWNVNYWAYRVSLLDRMLLRYAEVLLTYAEAAYELNGSISDAELDISLNLLRKRGEIALLSNAFVTANGLDMREEIRRERRVELAQENFRYWDIIRWKIAETELPKPVLGARFFLREFGNQVPVVLTADSIIIVQDASFRKFDPKKDYLWPIPINELALNPSLQQNPGW